jgi:RNA polymerase sigma-70 factor, ECF subfamily
MNALSYLDILYGYAMVLTCNRTHAEHIVTVTYKTPTVSACPWVDDRLKVHLLVTLRKVWIDNTKRNGSTCIGEGNPGPKRNDDHDLSSQSMETRIRDGIKQLSIEQREAIFLREYGGMSYQEIAEIVNTRVEDVTLHIRRARRELIRYLQDCSMHAPIHLILRRNQRRQQ